MIDPLALAELTDVARGLGFEVICPGASVNHGCSGNVRPPDNPGSEDAWPLSGEDTQFPSSESVQLQGNEVHFRGPLEECAAFLVGWGTLRMRLLGDLHAGEGKILRDSAASSPDPLSPSQVPAGEVPVLLLSRDQRQAMVMAWAEMAFGPEEARGLPQRGLRLLEEAIEAFQACGGSPEIAHELVTYMFRRPRGSLGQEVGGVAVTLLALADAAGLSAEAEERREVNRVLSRPVEEFSRRNAARNAAGFKMTQGAAR